MRDWRGGFAAEIPLAAAAVQRGIAVKHFLPATAAREPYAIVVTRHRREVADYCQRLLRRFASPHKADDARFPVAGIDPLKAGLAAIELVHRRLAAIESVQIADPPLQ